MADDSKLPNRNEQGDSAERGEFDEIVAALCDAQWLGSSSPMLESEIVKRLNGLSASQRTAAADQRWIDALLHRLSFDAVEEDRIRVERVIAAIQRGDGSPPLPDLSIENPDSHPLLPDSGSMTAGLFGSSRWIPLFSLLALMLIASVWVFGIRRNSQDRATEFVATLVSADDCVWGADAKFVGVGDGIPGNVQFDLLSGVAKLKFEAGATAVVEGPASFGLVSAKRMSLRYGSLVVRTDEKNKEFIVDSPDAAIVDLGTSFGVHCDASGATEVSVFEGAVEVRPTVNSDQGRVLGLGASAKISRADGGPSIEAIASDDRFATLVDALWDDYGLDADDRDGSVVVAEFNDAPIPGTVDTFYGSTRGRGWRTPWMAAGNPVGEVRNVDSLSEEGDPYLHMKFLLAKSRLVAREYGKRTDFDPLKPHVISWKWRFDGNPEHFGRHFKDRVLFYGSPRFGTNTSSSNSWTIRLATADEVGGRFRAGHPMNWCFFDSHAGEGGSEFSRRNLVDSGMTLKPGIVYDFAVAVYPESARYDVAIRDDVQTVIKKNLSFRSRRAGPSNVVHFGIRSEDETVDMAFSLDSVRIEQFADGELLEEVR